ncbi:MAG TPA: amidohydrolase family protein, partial [Acidobacteriota bacterium]|nr:amidohydrolase family protein [Acidobacteriota bacterium]
MRAPTKSRWPVAVVAICCLSANALPGAAPLDLLIGGGRIIDGTGNPWYAADVGIIGDAIVEIGDLSGRRAARTIDATGKVVSPGFIDMHTHVDRGFEQVDTAAILNYLYQGVTTVRPGSDGGASHRVSETKARWEGNGMGLNAVHMVGFNTVRREVMGYDFLRPASVDEIDQMQSLVRQAMREGSW